SANHPYFGVKLPRIPRGHGRRHRTKNSVSPWLIKQLIATSKRKYETPYFFYKVMREKTRKDMRLISQQILNNPNQTPLGNTTFYKFVQCYVASYYSKIQPDQSKPEYFLPVVYDNFGMEKLKFHTIFKDRSLQNLIPIDRSQIPKVTVTYTFDTPISVKVFNYSTFLSKIDLANPGVLTCDCANSNYIYAPAGHIISGDLNIVSDQALRELLSRGTKYRIPKQIDWYKTKKAAFDALNKFISHLSHKFSLSTILFRQFLQRCLTIIDNRINFLKRHKLEVPKSLWTKDTKQSLQNLQNKFVIVPADKASNNYVFVCQKFYLQVMCEELGITITPNNITVSGNNTYTPVQETKDSILARHNQILSTYNIDKPKYQKLPKMYVIPKLHKNPYGFRFISSAKDTSLQNLSLVLHKILVMLRTHLKNYCNVIKERSGNNYYWAINSSIEFLNKIQQNNNCKTAKYVSIYDFSTLFTSLPHITIKNNLFGLIDKLIEDSSYICVGYLKAFTSTDRKCKISFNKTELKELIQLVLKESYTTFGGIIFAQITGIPMGSAASPLLSCLTLSAMEYNYLHENRNSTKTNQLVGTSRYLDDICTFTKAQIFEEIAKDMYPPTLPLKRTNREDDKGPYLDLDISLQPLSIKLYNKTDDFPFEVHRFVHASSNVHSCVGIRVYKTQLIRIARICMTRHDFMDRSANLTKIFLSHKFKKADLMNSFCSFAKKYLSLLLKYQVYNSKDISILSNILFP
ncbi:MAG: hypothetical protein GY740_12840, partial [Gammaproteobacteria bacterium]|nr:hypothetical protein [Gammaproteobacteria bacterium]